MAGCALAEWALAPVLDGLALGEATALSLGPRWGRCARRWSRCWYGATDRRGRPASIPVPGSAATPWRSSRQGGTGDAGADDLRAVDITMLGRLAHQVDWMRSTRALVSQDHTGDSVLHKVSMALAVDAPVTTSVGFITALITWDLFKPKF